MGNILSHKKKGKKRNEKKKMKTKITKWIKFCYNIKKVHIT